MRTPLPFWKLYKRPSKSLPIQTYKGEIPAQCASDIKIKLQQLQQQDPSASLDEMVQTATNTFHNREQEREGKARKGKKGKRQGMLRCWPLSREAL